MVEVMKITATSFKRPPAHTAILSAPNPATGHLQPTPPPQTPGHSWTCLVQFLVGSLFLSSGSSCAQGLFVPSKSLFPQSCVSSGGLMVTSSKRAYIIPRALPLQQSTADPYLLQTQFCLSFWAVLSKSLIQFSVDGQGLCSLPIV